MASAEHDLTMSIPWQALKVHQQMMKNSHLLQLFAEDHHRGERFSIEENGIYLDYSKNLINHKTMELLMDLARAKDLPGIIEERFTAFHEMGCRTTFEQAQDREEETARMTALSDRIWNGAWTGYNGMRIKTVVILNVDESAPGPPMAHSALKSFTGNDLSIVFITRTNVLSFCTLLADLNPAETLVVVVSATFACRETMACAHMARRWILKAMRDESSVARHFIAVTDNGSEARKFGVDQGNIFANRSGANRNRAAGRLLDFETVVSLGSTVFRRIVAGIQSMDRHFATAPLGRNLPVIMGLLRVWYRNFHGSRQVAILPYHRQLVGLPAHVDRLFPGSDTHGGESMGAPGSDPLQKHEAVCRQIIEGNILYPCDFIGFCRNGEPDGESNGLLMAEMFALTRSLAFGGHASEFQDGKCRKSLRHYLPMEGNHPSNTILAESLTPEVLGELLALYEHAAFTQQTVGQCGIAERPGVELVRLERESLARELVDGSTTPGHDSSTSCLIRHYRSLSGMGPKICIP